MPLLQVKEISKKYGESLMLNSVSFEIFDKQKVAISGSTGSGKTTLLKIIAGIIQPNTGSVLFKSERIKGPDEQLMPGHSQIAYLSQHFELRNNYSVEAFLTIHNKMEFNKAEQVYRLCRIDHLLNRLTNQLSGGERQRVALASTLITSPRMLLLDEPYSNLDAIHKSILKKVINNISEQLGTTILLVSHDASDILPWADKVLILENGNLVQQGSPGEVYYQPANLYSAALLGRYSIITPGLRKYFTDISETIIRPSDIQFADTGLEAIVVQNEFMGEYYQALVRIGDDEIYCNHYLKDVAIGDKVLISLKK